MGHWEQIGVENRKNRERRAKWPRWRRVLHRHADAAFTAAKWVALVAIGLWEFGLL
jgi:hypothetical protein